MNINPGEPDPVPKKERIAFFAEKLSASFFTAALGRTGYAGTGTPKTGQGGQNEARNFYASYTSASSLTSSKGKPAYSAISSTASLPLAIIRRADSFFPL